MPQNFSRVDNATLAIFQCKWASSLISAVYVLVTLVNLCGNGLSMWLLLFRTSPKTPTIIFMINLTIADLTLGLVLPFQIVYLMQDYHWTMGRVMCNIVTVVFFANMYCSIMMMTAISVDRFLGIVKPICFREMRENNMYAILICLLMWLLVLAVLNPLLRTDLTFPVEALNTTTCFDFLKRDMLPSTAHWAAFLFGMFVVLFFCPFVITVYCYTRIICVLLKNSKTSQKDRAVRLAFTVLFVFIVCFAPNNILLLTHSIIKLYYGKSLYMYYKLSLSLSCINSCLDPFIYYFASKDFRRKMRQILNLRSLSTLENELTECHRDSVLKPRAATEDKEEVEQKQPISQGNSSF